VKTSNRLLHYTFELLKKVQAAGHERASPLVLIALKAWNGSVGCIKEKYIKVYL